MKKLQAISITGVFALLWACGPDRQPAADSCWIPGPGAPLVCNDKGVTRWVKDGVPVCWMPTASKAWPARRDGCNIADAPQ